MISLELLLPAIIGRIKLKRVGNQKARYVENDGMNFVPQRGEGMQIYAGLGKKYQLEEIIPWPTNPKIYEYASYASSSPASQKEILIDVPQVIASNDFKKGPGITQVKEKYWLYNLRKIK